MRPFHLPTRQLAVAFLVVQAIAMGGVMLWGHYAEPITVIEIITKVIGSNAILYSIWELFRKRIWRWRIFRWLGLVNFPDINGRWTGTLNWQGREADIPASITIRQTYTDISVAYTGVMSVSHSFAASFAITGEEDDHPNFFLLMTFRNERTSVQPKDEIDAHRWKEHISHRGTAALCIEGNPPQRLFGALWTESQGKGHETQGYCNWIKIGRPKPGL